MPQGQLQLSLRLCFLLARLFSTREQLFLADLHFFFSQQKGNGTFQKSSAVEFTEKICGILVFYKKKKIRTFFLVFFRKNTKKTLFRQSRTEWYYNRILDKSDQRIAK